MKCDICGKENKKLRDRKNYPFGKKSKARIIKTCKLCKLKQMVSKKEGAQNDG